jgi:hypothetical protein
LVPSFFALLFEYQPAIRRLTNMKTIDMGNNESLVIGIGANLGGTFTALTMVDSATFKTRQGAVKWLARRGYQSNGEKTR